MRFFFEAAIISPSDPRVAHYLHIKERDLVGRRGMFIAEGEVVLRVLVQSPLMETLSVLIAERRIDTLAPLLELLPQSVPVYCASQEVMDAIAGFHIHRGILALGRRRKTLAAQELLAALPPRVLVLALVGISNHDNMGGLFRNAAAFGASAIVADWLCCDPLYRKAIRVSAGAALMVPFAKLNPEDDILAVLRRYEITPFALSPAGSSKLSDIRRPPRAALLMGAEGQGLPDDILAKCEAVSIPIARGFDSLNVATASGIALYHFATAAFKSN